MRTSHEEPIAKRFVPHAPAFVTTSPVILALTFLSVAGYWRQVPNVPETSTPARPRRPGRPPLRTTPRQRKHKRTRHPPARPRAGHARDIEKMSVTVMELFVMDRHQHQQAAALVIMLDIHPFRHTSTARSRWPASSRRAAGQQRGGRREGRTHAPRSSPRARTAATSVTSEVTNGIREANTAGNY